MAKWNNKMGDGEKIGGNISAFIFVLGGKSKSDWSRNKKVLCTSRPGSHSSWSFHLSERKNKCTKKFRIQYIMHDKYRNNCEDFKTR